MSLLPKIVEEKEITEEVGAEVLEKLDTTHINHGDSDMGRSQKQQIADTFYGLLGEYLFYEMVKETDDLRIAPSNTTEFDFDINGFDIELKTRKAWAYDGQPDLLVRTIDDFTADVYVMTELYGESITIDAVSKENIGEVVVENVESCSIVGYIFSDKIPSVGRRFNPQQKINDTLLVERSNLGPFHKLHAELK